VTPFQMVAFCLCSASCCFLAMMVAMRVAYKPESTEPGDCPQIPLGSLVRHRDGFFAQARVIDYSGPTSVYVSLVSEHSTGGRFLQHLEMSVFELERIIDTDEVRGLIDG